MEISKDKQLVERIKKKKYQKPVLASVFGSFEGNRQILYANLKGSGKHSHWKFWIIYYLISFKIYNSTIFSIVFVNNFDNWFAIKFKLYCTDFPTKHTTIKGINTKLNRVFSMIISCLNIETSACLKDNWECN